MKRAVMPTEIGAPAPSGSPQSPWLPAQFISISDPPQSRTETVSPALSPPLTAFPMMPSQAGATNRLFPLRCAVMTYAWGRVGEASLVGRLAVANDSEFSLEQGTPYAELWMGTHPNGPSMVLLEMPWRTITPLYEWLKLNPSIAGKRRGAVVDAGRRRSMANRDRHALPFLMKVLSVRTALSIQAHPDRQLARKLHAAQPHEYKDDNHKPEMAIAVSRFEALCSFQKATYVLENCRACPELVAVVGEDVVTQLAAAVERAAPLTPVLPPSPAAARRGSVDTRAPQVDPSAAAEASEARLEVVRPALRELFSRLMRAEDQVVKRNLDALMRRIAMTNEMLRTPVDELAVRLHEQYPSDHGVFCVYLLNYLALEPGQALFLGANEPHAYISGECVECMASSDNVVRAGLTPKFKDVENLTSMLTYIDGPPNLISGDEIGPNVLRYVTPVDEFIVDRVMLEPGTHATLPSAPGVSIVLVLSGGGAIEEMAEDSIGSAGLSHNVEAGAVFVASADTFMRVRALEQPMVVFRAAEKY
jgi:mannose-6-phosphate isomerase